jgi:hypothetical protein
MRVDRARGLKADDRRLDRVMLDPGLVENRALPAGRAKVRIMAMVGECDRG